MRCRRRKGVRGKGGSNSKDALGTGPRERERLETFSRKESVLAQARKIREREEQRAPCIQIWGKREKKFAVAREKGERKGSRDADAAKRIQEENLGKEKRREKNVL